MEESAELFQHIIHNLQQKNEQDFLLSAIEKLNTRSIERRYIRQGAQIGCDIPAAYWKVVLSNEKDRDDEVADCNWVTEIVEEKGEGDAEQ